jgi:transposase
MEWPAEHILLPPPFPMPLLSIGIDVSKDNLVIALRSTNEEKRFTVANSPAGIRSFTRRVPPANSRLILESTGRYHLLPAYLLSQRGYDVRVVNPLAAKRYINASVRKRKTDATDASALAHMGSVDQRLPAPFALQKEDIAIRQQMGLLSSLERQMQSLHAMLKSYRSFQEEIGILQSPAEADIARTVAQLQRQMEQLAKEMQKAIVRDGRHKQDLELACTIPGIAPLTASLLCQLLDRTCCHPKQWIAFVGLDIAQKQSGTWKGRGKLSKRGNSYLRKRLFCAAWGAVMNDPQFRAAYDHLRAEGRSYREAMIILARKQLRILFAVWKHQHAFSPLHCMNS